MDFCDSYSKHFVGRGINSVMHARHYLSGLLGKERRKNIERIELDVKGSDYQGMEQFISSSPWSHRQLVDHIAQDANALLGDKAQAGLYIDESSFLKKGHASVGVKRQWSGRAGKIENCQVGVFACLGRLNQVALTDFRLFLPESWATDQARLNKAKVPTSERRYEPKWKQALAMVKHARALGLQFGWVGVDSLYGCNAQFINGVEDLGERFMADVHKTNKVWTSRPSLQEPSTQAGKLGRPRSQSRLHSDNQARYVSVEQLQQEHFEDKSRRLKYRQGTGGQLWARFWVRKVWCWEKGWDKARARLLIIRQDSDGGFKYSLSNLASGKDWSYYGFVQGQRFWIEHAFQEAKSQLGMAQYQVRLWQGWHHHMALVALALLFTTKLKAQHIETTPLLSVRDITELLDYYLPRNDRSEEGVWKAMKKRHELRQLDIDRKRHKQNGVPI